MTRVVEALRARMEELRRENEQLEALVHEAEGAREAQAQSEARLQVAVEAGRAREAAQGAALQEATRRVQELQGRVDTAESTREGLRTELHTLRVRSPLVCVLAGGWHASIERCLFPKHALRSNYQNNRPSDLFACVQHETGCAPAC